VGLEPDWLSTNLCHPNFKPSQNVGVPILGQTNISARQSRLVIGLLPAIEENVALPKFWKKLPMF
jgi:hypothetical protein